MMAKLTEIADSALPEPKDLSHHFSEVTKNRQPSAIKEYYKFFKIPGIGNLAGGLPNSGFFPFDTLEAQVAQIDRFTPTPNYPGQPGDGHDDRKTAQNGTPASSHLAIPRYSMQSNSLEKIDLNTALQYGTAEGYPPLLSFVRQFTRENLHPNVPYRGGPEVIMSCGSTDGFSKTMDLLTNPWSKNAGDDIREKPGILCEPFMYTNVLAQVQPRGITIVPVEMDEVGMLARGRGGLNDVLENWDTSEGKRPHLLYTVTMGHNPTGGVLPMKRRKELYAICRHFDIILIEDDPYWYLQYPSADRSEALSRGLPEPVDEQPTYSEKLADDVFIHSKKSSGYEFIDSLVPSYLSIDVDGRVIRLDTFSKTVAPGCRLGYVTAQPMFIERFARIAETTTQQPSGFVQGMIAQLLLGHQPEKVRTFLSLSPAERVAFTGWSTSGWVRWLEGLRGAYERRMTNMCKILDAGKDGIRDLTAGRDLVVVLKAPRLYFDWPRGGMFAWVKVHLEHHRFIAREGRTGQVFTGKQLADALLVFLTKAPYKVLAAPGRMFAATEQIGEERAWKYFRLCFAAEADDRVDSCSRMFVRGVHDFFDIKDVREIEKLVDEASEE